jgi:DNA-binding LacI/PurR family transcriptional regulator
VDGVFVVDLRVNDPRIPAIEKLRMPAVVIGPPGGAGPLPSVWPDDRAAADIVVGYLAAQGHQRIALVGGQAAYWQSKLRRDAFEAAAAVAGLTAFTVEADSGAGGSAAGGSAAGGSAQATLGLLGSAEPPTAILYDSDVLAAAGLAVAQRRGTAVPGEVSILSWDDSALCELVHPALTALRGDVAAAGTAAARMLRELAAGGEPESLAEAAPLLQVRMSSGPAGIPAVAVPRSRLTA